MEAKAVLHVKNRSLVHFSTFVLLFSICTLLLPLIRSVILLRQFILGTNRLGGMWVSPETSDHNMQMNCSKEIALSLWVT